MPEEGAPAQHARWIAGHVLANRVETLLGRDIGRVYNALRGHPIEIATAMDVLVHAGWACPAHGRKDSQRWAINPAVHIQFAAAAAMEKARRNAMVELIRTKVSNL